MDAPHSLLQQRYRDVARVRLGDLLGRTSLLRTLSPALLQSTSAVRSSLAAELTGAGSRSVAERMARTTRDFLCNEYQYIEFDRWCRGELDTLYTDFVGEIAEAVREDDLRSAIERRLDLHHERLRDLVCHLLVRCGADSERASAGALCAEYTPELQLAVLGADERALAEPILDIGCGAKPALLGHLRALGYRAVIGLDRSVEPGPGLLDRSWFDLDLPPGVFGTIIAHLSFSLHFLHVHLRSGNRSELFAAKYMEILRALKPGGRFFYAPGLPFIEQHLSPAHWRITQLPLSLPLLWGNDLLCSRELYATVVERR